MVRESIPNTQNSPVSSDQRFSSSLLAVDVVLAGVPRKIPLSHPWDIKFDDIEEFYALHRFGWLLVAYAEKRLDWREGVQYINKWIADHGDYDEAKGWDSYSISERLANWVVYIHSLCCHDEAIDTSNIKQSITQQAARLIQNLEFRGPATNNHIINNGRALYLAGILTGNDTYSQCGREILLNGLEHMFYSSGFLREGSSHYHILLTRTYLEVVVFAKHYRDSIFEQLLRNKVKKLWEAACFFLEEKPLPVFGDVSPDFLTSFHMGVTIVGGSLFKEKYRALSLEKPGWHTLFPEIIKNDPGPETPEHGLAWYDDAGYFRFRNQHITLYAHINPLGHVPAWSHGHADISSVILYIDGQRILVGTGRFNYNSDTCSDYGRSFRSHNTVGIGTKEPCMVHGLNGFPELILKDYLKRPVVKIENQGEGCCHLCVTNSYFVGWGGNSAIVSRSMEINNKKLIIQDEVAGKGKRQICSFFHFDPALQFTSLDNTSTEVSWGEEGCRGVLYFSHPSGSNIYKACSDNVHSQEKTFGWYYPEYGVALPCYSLCFYKTARLSVTNRYSFSIE